MGVIIIDYGLGNLHSVKAACLKVGLMAKISNDAKEVLTAEAIILPGVGAFSEAMKNLSKFGLDDAIKEYASSNKPILGICLGFQLLFDRSFEFGNHNGLGLISGDVKEFDEKTKSKCSIPHVGWCLVTPKEKRQELSLYRKLRKNEYFYFVHSFLAVPINLQVVSAEANYCHTRFCASISYENIHGVQFHPEKSGPAGLSVFEAFGELVNISKKRTIE